MASHLQTELESTTHSGQGASEPDLAQRRLMAALTDAGELPPDAHEAIPGLLAALDSPDGTRRGRVVLLLGLLAEAGGSMSSDVSRRRVRAHLDRYLRVLARERDDAPLVFALLFLLGHFPEDGQRILEAAAALSLRDDDRTRLERCLDPSAAAAYQLGRVWPSPAAWELTDDERRVDPGGIRSLDLTAAESRRIRDLETQALLAYSGAKAAHALATRESSGA